MSEKCSRCPKDRRSPNQRLCRGCHAQAMRETRDRQRQRWRDGSSLSRIDELIESIRPYEPNPSQRSTCSVTFHVEPGHKMCAKRCGRPRDLGYSAYCRACRNAYVRQSRPRHRDMSPAIRRRANCRAHTKALQARGVLPKGPCEGCGEPDAQNHHHWGYDRPRWFVRLCADCHRALERSLSGTKEIGL